jgi:FkbM family methyltransferase
MQGLAGRLIGAWRGCARWPARRRSVFIDCGANVGRVLERQLREHPTRECFALEANPELIPALQAVRDRHPRSTVHILHCAAWNCDGVIPFYKSGLNSHGQKVHDGSTALLGKSPRHPLAGVIDYEHPLEVPSVDFSAWIKRTFSPADAIHLKMDIEGAEYVVLDKMLSDGTIDYLDEAAIEFHYSDDGRISTLDKAQHERIVAQVGARTRLVEWH